MTGLELAAALLSTPDDGTAPVVLRIDGRGYTDIEVMPEFDPVDGWTITLLGMP